MKPLDIVICGLTITSSWGNGHATMRIGVIGAGYVGLARIGW